MPREVQGERPGRRARRRVLGDSAAGSEHARLPVRAGAGEAVEPQRGGKLAEACQVRLQRGHVLLGRQRHVDVLDAVVVRLDGKLGALDAQRCEQLGLFLVGLHGGQRLLHPPECDPARLVALERDRDRARAGLEPDLAELERRARTKAVPSVGWPAKGISAAGVKIRIRACPSSSDW